MLLPRAASRVGRLLDADLTRCSHVRPGDGTSVPTAQASLAEGWCQCRCRWWCRNRLAERMSSRWSQREPPGGESQAEVRGGDPDVSH